MSSLLRSILPARALLSAALSLAALAPLAAVDVRDAHADEDPRASARTHYQAGQKAYAAGDYRLAIREFAAAEQLAPSGFNDYNLGLCYDKLGEADPAVRYYRSYLERVPEAKNRAAVEASVARLESALTSAQSKEQARLEAERRAEEMRQAEAARRAEEERLAEAKRAEEAKRAAEEAKRAEEAKAAQAKNGAKDPVDPGEEPPPQDQENKISAAEPTAGTVRTTGNDQLDRANAIDLAAIRTQRAPLLGSSGATAGKGMSGGDPAVQDQGNVSSASKESPFYKKWWFWAIVGVGAYVVISAAVEEDESASGRNGFLLDRTLSNGASGSGATLLRW